MKVYKVVVSAFGLRPSAPKGSYISARTWMYKYNKTSRTVLLYSIGKVTRPHFGFIFCFDTLKNASAFHKKYGGHILECVGVPASEKLPMCFIDCGTTEYKMNKCWKDATFTISDFKEHNKLPAGTVMMRTLRPIKEVQPCL